MRLLGYFCLAAAALSWGCSTGEPSVLQLPVAEVEAGEKQLLHYPKDGQEIKVNPPGFTWTNSRLAASYELLLFRGDPSGDSFRRLSGLQSTVGILDEALPEGSYSWLVVYLGQDGQPEGPARRAMRSPPGAGRAARAPPASCP